MKPSSERAATSMRRRLAQFGLLFASLGICFSVGEMLARRLYPQLSSSETFHDRILGHVINSRIHTSSAQRSYDPILGHRYPPNESFELRKPEFSLQVRTNVHGFRSPEPRPKQLGEYRVLLLGDSMLFTGVEIEELVSTQLERRTKLASPALPHSVYNYSTPGYNTVQELLVAKMFHAELAADDVVLGVFLDNDPVTNALSGIDAQGRYQLDDAKLRRLGDRLRHRLRWVPPSTLIRTIVDKLGAPRIRYEIALEPAAIDRTVALILQIREVVGRTGASLTVLLMPSRWALNGPASYWLRSREYGDRLKSNLHEQGVETIDLLDLFLEDPDPDRLFYPNDGHFTAQGHAETARAIFDAVVAPRLLASPDGAEESGR